MITYAALAGLEVEEQPLEQVRRRGYLFRLLGDPGRVARVAHSQDQGDESEPRSAGRARGWRRGSCRGASGTHAIGAILPWASAARRLLLGGWPC